MVETAWEAKSLCEKIIDRQGQYENLREPYDDRIADIVDFTQPGLTAWKQEDNTEGQFRGENIFEGTPAHAARVMADGWLGNIVSEVLQWFKYAFSDKILRDDDSVNQYLQDTEDHMYSVYRNSQLYEALSPFTLYGITVGSPVIIPYEDRDEKRIKCEVPNPRENFFGPRDAYHRKYDFTALEAVRKFMGGKIPDDILDAKLSNDLLSSYKGGQHAKKYTFIRAIYRSDDPILESAEPEYRAKPWMEFYVEKTGSDVQHKKGPILVQGYWTKPYIRWDYEINTDEIWARTPGWHAIMDIRTGQEFAKQRIERGQQELHPPMWVQRKYKGRLHMRPKGFTYYDTIDEAGSIPQPILDRSNYNVGKDVHEGMINVSVERWFHYDLFRILSRLAEQQKGGWPTATHILSLNAEKASILAPRIGRYNNVLRQIDNRFQDIERRAERMPPMPDILLEYMAWRKMMFRETEIQMDMEFIGPLGQMQQRGITLGRVQAGLGIIQEFMKVDPMIPYKIRSSVACERALEQVGFYQDAIVPESEYQEILSAIAQKEQQDKAMEQIGTVADAIPNISKTIEPGSPLGEMTAAVEGVAE